MDSSDDIICLEEEEVSKQVEKWKWPNTPEWLTRRTLEESFRTVNKHFQEEKKMSSSHQVNDIDEDDDEIEIVHENVKKAITITKTLVVALPKEQQRELKNALKNPDIGPSHLFTVDPKFVKRLGNNITGMKIRIRDSKSNKVMKENSNESNSVENSETETAVSTPPRNETKTKSSTGEEHNNNRHFGSLVNDSQRLSTSEQQHPIADAHQEPVALSYSSEFFKFCKEGENSGVIKSPPISAESFYGGEKKMSAKGVKTKQTRSFKDLLSPVHPKLKSSICNFITSESEEVDVETIFPDVHQMPGHGLEEQQKKRERSFFDLTETNRKNLSVECDKQNGGSETISKPTSSPTKGDDLSSNVQEFKVGKKRKDPPSPSSDDPKEIRSRPKRSRKSPSFFRDLDIDKSTNVDHTLKSVESSKITEPKKKELAFRTPIMIKSGVTLPSGWSIKIKSAKKGIYRYVAPNGECFTKLQDALNKAKSEVGSEWQTPLVDSSPPEFKSPNSESSPRVKRPVKPFRKYVSSVDDEAKNSLEELKENKLKERKALKRNVKKQQEAAAKRVTHKFDLASLPVLSRSPLDGWFTSKLALLSSLSTDKGVNIGQKPKEVEINTKKIKGKKTVLKIFYSEGLETILDIEEAKIVWLQNRVKAPPKLPSDLVSERIKQISSLKKDFTSTSPIYLPAGYGVRTPADDPSKKEVFNSTMSNKSYTKAYAEAAMEANKSQLPFYSFF